MKKRILAVLLCIIMVLTLMPVTAFATSAIIFTTQPESNTFVTVGSITESLTAEASVSPSGTAILNWYACSEAGVISGNPIGTGKTFTIPTNLNVDVYFYRCQATYGDAEPVNSRVAAVLVAPKVEFTAQPAPSTTVTAGSITGNLTVETSVYPASTTGVTLNWYRASSGGAFIYGESLGTGKTFTIPDMLTPGTYDYLCQATIGTSLTVKSDVATVTVEEATDTTSTISFTAQPDSTTYVTEGFISEALTASASVSPSGTPTLKWYACTGWTGVVTGEPSLGTGEIFAIPTDLLDVPGKDYYFVCQATYPGAAPVNSRVATVRVAQPPTTPTMFFTTQPDLSTTVTQGSIHGNLTAVATVSPLSSGPTPTLTWYACNQYGYTSGEALSTSNTLAIPTELAPGTYYFVCEAHCEGIDSSWKDSRIAEVTVRPAATATISFTQHPLSKFSVTVGRASNLIAAANVSPSGTATLNWYACDENGVISGASLGTGDRFAVLRDTAGVYYYLCQATYEGAYPVNSNVSKVTAWPAVTDDADFEDAPGSALALINRNKTPGAVDSTWDSATKTLTLNGVDFTNVSAASTVNAITLPAGSTIVLGAGTVNTIRSEGIQGTCIREEGGLLTVTGAGTLNLIADNIENGMSTGLTLYGRYADIAVTGGAVVNITSGYESFWIDSDSYDLGNFDGFPTDMTVNGSATYNNFSNLSAVAFWPEDFDVLYMGVDAEGDEALTVRLAHNTAKVATPVMSLGTGEYTGTQSVTLSCATPYYTDIRYTTDGSEPTASSTLYTGTVSIISTATMKAKAFATGIGASDTASATYTIAGTTPPSTNATSVWIAGAELTEDNPYYHNGDSTANNTDTGYNAYFNAETAELTLNGLTVTDSTATQEINLGNETIDFAYAVCADGDLNMILNGSNSVSTADNAGGKATIIALGVSGNLSVTGTGSLTATAGTGDVSYGMYIVGNLAVSSGTLVCNAGSAGDETTDYAESIGVYADKSVVITGGSLTGNGNTATATDDSLSTGVYAYDNLSVDGGALTAVSGTDAALSFGIIAYYGTISISSGALTAKTLGDTATSVAMNTGLICEDGITAKGSISDDGSNPTPYVRTDNISYKWVSVQPSLTVSASLSGSVTAGTAVVLTATPENIPNPTYQWYSNIANKTAGATIVTGATAAIYAPPTASAGTVYYYCVSGTVTGNIVGVTVTLPENYYLLSFETNGGSAISAITRAKGNTVDLTSYSSARDGYSFMGWYSDEALTTAVTSVTLTENLTVYARWGRVNPFTDVRESNYFYNAILWAVSKNITSGTSATTFSPADSCTRAQMATFMWRAAGCPEPTASVNPFTDVKESAYYYKAVMWAVEKGITLGTSATTFSPNNTCTRGQMATFLYRYAGTPVVTGSNPFTDVSASDYYCNAVIWAASEGVTQGTSATTFSPKSDCTRGQIVTFLFRYLG